MIDMIMDGNDPSDSKLADICDSIIILHSPNNTLIGKFKHYFYSTQ